jgi:Arc/MetJ-type ribon-helix-helix transcriptional regulator
MNFFKKIVSVRLHREQLSALEELQEKHSEKYFSDSHAIRCAICVLLEIERRAEEDENRRIKH